MALAIRLVIGLAAAAVAWTLVEVLDARSQPPPTCMPSEEDRERVRAIMMDAIDAAFKDQIMHLFEVWMKDSKDQPTRAVTGARNATRAYVGSRKSVSDWSPPIC